MSRRFEQIQKVWRTERTRHFLWVPVCFAAGIALYYAWPSEPMPRIFPVLAVLAGLAAAWLRGARPLMLGLCLLMLGASWAELRAHQHPPTMLHQSLSPRYVEGVVRDMERTERGVRLLLAQVQVEGLSPEATPKQIRLSVKFKKDAVFELPRIGERITIRAGLMPAMGPALPHGFDFARYFYFRDIGAIGYGLPPWKVEKKSLSPLEGEGLPRGNHVPEATYGEQTTAQHFWTWRANLTDRIVRELGAETGGIAAGLITGDGRAIPKEDFAALRASNLYHIIAISGEHMVIIAGVIFISLRLLLLLLPARFALRPEGKSVAACVSLLLVSIYLLVTGLPISAVRAYVMIVLVLLAIILRRQVDGVRSLAITALLILLYDPASLLDPGFQLSFAATLAILALVESRWLAPPPAIERGRVRRVMHTILTVLLVSVVAEASTMPLAVRMFNNASLYGVLANSLATPLVSLLLMPLVALFFILLPFGLEGVALTLLHQGITALLGLARAVASLPHAQIFLPSLPSWGLALFAVGLLWMCLWKTRMRRYGILPALIGVASLWTVQPPDVLVGNNLKTIAFRAEDGGFVLARGRANAMLAELWANGVGYAEFPKAQAPAWQCNEQSCTAQLKHWRVAFPKDEGALADACQKAGLVISTTSKATCANGTPILAPSVHGGTMAVWRNDNGTLRTETSRDWQGERLWSVAEEVESGEEGE